MSAAALEVRDLHTSFFTPSGPVKAVRGVSLDLAPGQMLGVVGESGAGKSTLARSILGAVPPPGRVVAGETRLFERDLQQMTDAELGRLRGKEIAMIVPNPRTELNPLLPVGIQLANVAQAHLGLDRQGAWNRALEMLHDVKIPDPVRRARAYPHELSGGMAQRVVIAMALICDPKVILSDDATSGLDVTVQAQVLALTMTLMREHRTACMTITRDLGIVAQYCDRVAVMYRGVLLESADVRGFFSNPRHPYSTELLEAFSYKSALSEHASSRMLAPLVPYDADELEMQAVAPGHYVRTVG